MKKYVFHFNSYQNKIKTLPGLVVFFIIILVILLIPVILCLALAIGICWGILSSVVRLITPSKKNKKNDDIITIPVEEVKRGKNQLNS